MRDRADFEKNASLCMSCGFCCDGTLFANTPVRDADNIQPLKTINATFLVFHTRKHFEQPCPAFAQQSCKIYTDRPSICREFRCKLLDGYREQKISWREAQEKINQVIALRKKLLNAVQDTAPSLPGMALQKLWEQWNRSATGENGLAFRQKHSASLMQMAALRWYLWEHFYGEDKPDLLLPQQQEQT